MTARALVEFIEIHNLYDRTFELLLNEEVIQVVDATICGDKIRLYPEESEEESEQ